MTLDWGIIFTMMAEEHSSSEAEILTHDELLDISYTTLNELFKNDILLHDLPSDVTLEEVQAQIALAHGQSMTVYVVRDDGEEMPIVVRQQGAVVLDLKRAIRRHVTLKLSRGGQQSKANISWHYVWRTNWLVHDGVKLKDDNAFLADYGVKNRSRVSFVQRLGERGQCKMK